MLPADTAVDDIVAVRKRSIRVLLIDDDAADRKLIHHRFSKSGLSVQIEDAENAALGLQRALEESFDCVLLDYQLPDIKGTEVLRRLTELRTSIPLAVIVLTGRGDERTAVESMKLGAQDYLVKDVTTPGNLERAVGNAIEKVTLAHALEQQRKALSQAHSELEDKVRDRTRALTETNRRLHEEIAQRVISEEALRASEARFQDLYDHSPDMLVSVEPESARIMRCNITVANALGYTREQIVGRNVFDLYEPECAAEARRAFETFLRTGEMRDTDLRLRRNGGGTIDISLSATALHTEDDTIDYVRFSWRDITERRQLAEETRRHHAELAHVARLSTLGEMASGLAHELNQPLTAIANFCELAVELVETRSAPEKLTPVLTKASAQAHRAGDIIRRLRALVRKNSDEMVFSDLNNAIEEAVTFLETEAREKRVSLEKALDKSLPLLRIDRIQIQQVVLNLLRNSIEAMDGEQTEARAVSVTSSPQGDGRVLVTVSDTGPGLSDERLARIFHPFETTKAEGMGLGLSISHSIIEAHGGRLWAHSELGKGATFHFSLPIGSTEKP